MEKIFKSWIVNKPIAHRGLHNKSIPENSFLAFNCAVQGGYPIEIDVHLSKDNEVVIFHDRNLKRMTGVDGLIDNFTLKEIKKLKLNNSNESIPTLKELLELVKGKVPILIEIKGITRGGRLEGATYNLLKNYDGEYAIQSFNPFSVRWFKKNAKEVCRGQLSCCFENQRMSKLRKFILKHMLLNSLSKPQFIAYKGGDLLQKNKRITKLPILAWTVANQEEYNKLKPICDNIIFEGFVPKVD